ncbi:hypothetical protein F503_04201 [Ophiostoma piceae UAMH 11346]|uniref:2EXR domain-containing protein n=1 Tax=Ophiostoma piceae (strain UAMH 11346) TaxID=1262450 RepID=S3C535_OPHP1|nr:hypothetical protein F503_04201 [Ophiostoma piceae UAMH 11346]
MKSFSRFSDLPPELRLSIWEAAVISPSVHVFDVCMPDLNGEPFQNAAEKRADVAFKRNLHTKGNDDTRYNKFKNTVFFDVLSGELDPSMYRWKMALASSCFDAFRVASPLRSLVTSGNSGNSSNSGNSVYLPGPDRLIHYDNEADILHLRFGPAQYCPKRPLPLPETNPDVVSIPSVSPSDPVIESSMLSDTAVETVDPSEPAEEFVENGLLDRQWSAELAVTIRTARRIAIDAGQTNALVNVNNNPILYDEIHMLASTMACALEVLYLVDSCSSGGCIDCEHDAVRPEALRRKRLLYNGLNDCAEPSPPCETGAVAATAPLESPPEIFHGIGMTYTQVFDLEGLGWTNQHPAYIFGKALGEAIREQQADAGAVIFKGVRVLVAENVQLHSALKP